MCGIFGLISRDPFSFSKVQKPVETLIKSTHSRGKEASGIASLSVNHQVDLLKSDLDGKKLLRSKDYKGFVNEIKSKQLVSVFGHSRLATHGSQLVHQNNQPVVSNQKKIIVVHNGIITNPDSLWSLMGRQEKMPVLDTQVLVDYLEYKWQNNSFENALISTFKELEGSASLTLLLPASETIVLATNTGSLYYCRNQASQSTFFASERIFFGKCIPSRRNRSSETFDSIITLNEK